MEFPLINAKPKTRQMVDAFMGYNHNLRIGDGEFYNMENMTSDYYPVLAPRTPRGVYATGVTATGIVAKESLCYIDGEYFVIGEDRVHMGLSEDTKSLTSMGAYVIIMPDRKYINTAKSGDTYEYGSIDEVHSTAADVVFTLCNISGEEYTNAETGATAPSDPVDGSLWIDTSTEPHILKKYSTLNAIWVSIPTTYIKIRSTGIGTNLNRYDGVTLSGIVATGIEYLNGSHALWGCTEDEIIITGIIDQVTTQTVSQGSVTVSRKMPDMDYVIESGNRLWGCRYGKNAQGEMINEIYSSKLGDFKNWNCFMNLSTDSYTVSCGSDGPFTGAITHLGFPLFFKENCIHKVYGDIPANFRLQNTACRGVQKGSHKSLAIVNETLYYKSGSAVCAYDGSLPVEMSSALGDVRYTDAIACAYGNKYYISMKSSDGYSLFAYDTAKGMWHREDALQVDDLCAYLNEIYAIDHGTKDIITMLGSHQGTGEVVPWMVETGLIGMSQPDMKYISKITVRLSLDAGAKVDIGIQYDSIGDWMPVCEINSTTLRSYSVPILPRRCDHFRIRMSGQGKTRIYSVAKTLEQGSDVS